MIKAEQKPPRFPGRLFLLLFFFHPGADGGENVPLNTFTSGGSGGADPLPLFFPWVKADSVQLFKVPGISGAFCVG